MLVALLLALSLAPAAVAIDPMSMALGMIVANKADCQDEEKQIRRLVAENAGQAQELAKEKAAVKYWHERFLKEVKQ